MEDSSSVKRHRSPSPSSQQDAKRQSGQKSSKMQDQSAAHQGEEAEPTAEMAPEPKADEPSAAEVLEWLTVLEQNNMEPAEFFVERKRMQDLRARLPNYTLAATKWPQYADRYWSTVGPKALAFFSQDPRKGQFAFVQWLLEYLSYDMPEFSRSDPSRRGNILSLTDKFCTGAVLPLPVAAALGLSKLCDELIENGASLVDGGLLMPPPHCAIMGRATFLALGQALWTWEELLSSRGMTLSETPRYAIWQRMRQAGLLESLHAEKKNAKAIARFGQFCSFAFVGAMCWEDVDVFTSLLGNHWTTTWGLSMLELLEPALMTRVLPSPSRAFFEKLLTAIFDATLSPSASDALESTFDQVRELIRKVLDMRGLNFCETQNQIISKWTTEDYLSFLAKSGATLGDEMALDVLSRLAVDPRFDPRLKLEKYDNTGKLGGEFMIHVAVSADHGETVDFLMMQGADMEARDVYGRPPLMLVESLEMLQRLINSYSADTTAVDRLGRNLWHFVTNTDEIDMVNWLWFHDRDVEINLQALDSDGNTPLASAVLFPRPEAMIASRAITFLLSNASDPRCFRSSKSLPHQIVLHQPADVVALAAHVGIDFTVRDANGATVWSCLNSRSSVELIRAVAEACPPEEAGIYQTSPEIALFAIMYSPGCHCLENSSSHATRCQRLTLDADAFKALLTEEAFAHKDIQKRDIWQRFTHMVQAAEAMKETHSCRSVRTSIKTAASCLISAGALRQHTARHCCSGLCFLPKLDKFEYWDIQIRLWGDLFGLVLDNIPEKHKQMFGKWSQCGRLVFHALTLGSKAIPRSLSQSSHHIRLPITRDKADSGTKTKLQDIIRESWKDREIMTLFLRFVSVGQLEDNASILFNIYSKSVTCAGERREWSKAQYAVLVMLLQAGLNPNRRLFHQQPESQRGFMPGNGTLSDTPLFRAVQDERLPYLELLLEYGANPLFLNSSALRLAAQSGSTEFLKLMLAKVPQDWKWDRQGVEILVQTSRHQQGRTEAIECMLQNSSLAECLSLRVPEVIGPVQYAALNGHLDLLKLYKQYGADLSIGTLPLGWTPLHGAVHFQKSEVVEYLLEQDFSLYQNTTTDGLTAFDHAVKSGNEKMVSFLQEIMEKRSKQAR